MYPINLRDYSQWRPSTLALLQGSCDFNSEAFVEEVEIEQVADTDVTVPYLQDVETQPGPSSADTDNRPA